MTRLVAMLESASLAFMLRALTRTLRPTTVQQMTTAATAVRARSSRSAATQARQQLAAQHDVSESMLVAAAQAVHDAQTPAADEPKPKRKRKSKAQQACVFHADPRPSLTRKSSDEAEVGDDETCVSPQAPGARELTMRAVPRSPGSEEPRRRRHRSCTTSPRSSNARRRTGVSLAMRASTRSSGMSTSRLCFARAPAASTRSRRKAWTVRHLVGATSVQPG